MNRAKGKARLLPVTFNYFMERSTVDTATGCYIWNLARDRRGYGTMMNSMKAKCGESQIHRAAYRVLVLNGAPIPDGMELDHLCRNRSCWRPDHLEPVTHLENVRRSARLLTHCKNSHEFIDETTYYSVEGWRGCRICRREKMQAWFAAHPTYHRDRARKRARSV